MAHSSEIDLIVGGSGFVGSHIARELRSRGRSVRILDIQRPQFDESGIEYVKGSVLDTNLVNEAMAGVERVFHLAAVAHLWHRRSSVYQEVNVKGCKNVLEQSLQHNVKRFIYTSSTVVLPETSADSKIETAEATPLNLMIGRYAQSKLQAQRWVETYEKRGLPVTLLYPAAPLGPGDVNMTPPTQMLMDFKENKIPAYVDGYLQFVDVRDAALAHVLAAEKPGNAPYVLSSTNISIHDFFEHAAGIIGVHPPRIKVPYSLALFFAYLEEACGRITGRKPQSSVAGLKLSQRVYAYQSSADISWDTLGIKPRPLAVSLEDAFGWLARNH